MLLLMLQGRFRRESTSEGLKTLKYCSLANPMWGSKQLDWAARKSTHFNVAIRCYAFVFPLPARLHPSPSFSPLWTKKLILKWFLFPSSVFGVLFLENVFAAVAFRNFPCLSLQLPSRTQLALFSSIYSITETKIFRDSRKYYAAMRKNTSSDNVAVLLASIFRYNYSHSLLRICRVGRRSICESWGTFV